MNLINLKLAFRNLGRNKLYTFINITGLSIACAFCILTFWYVRNERSFDNFHKDQDRLFRVEQTDIFGGVEPAKKKESFFLRLFADNQQNNMIQTPVILSGDLKANFPQVDQTVRVKSFGDAIVRVDNESFREKGENITYADDNFFKVFNYPLLYGNARSVLNNLNGAVISERAAKKYFGYTTPIGRRIEFPNEKQSFVVTGVVKDFTSNSSFQFDIIIPRLADPGYKDSYKGGTNQFGDLLIVKLKPGTDVERFKNHLQIFAKKYYAALAKDMAKATKSKVVDMNIYLRPLADAHYNASRGWDHYTSLKNVYQFIGLSIIILVIAALNYILLTLTGTISRSQDVGVRKTIGADRRQIILQYYTETQLLTCISVFIGLVLAVVFLPFFNGLTNSNISLLYVDKVDVALYLLLLALVMGLLAGIYPALALSGLKPLNIMRGFSAFRINPTLSRSFVIIQFTVCVVLIVATLTIGRQMKFINNAQMGFDKDQVMQIQNPYSWLDKAKAFALKERLNNYIASNPSLGGMTTAAFNFAGPNHNGHIINGERVFIEQMNIDFNFFGFNKIPIVKGRDFSKDIPTDSAKIKLEPNQKTANSSSVGKAVVVNESLYKLLGNPPIEEINPALGARIIGVCKDYHNEDLTKPISPAYHEISTFAPGFYWVKIKAGQNVAKAVEDIRKQWSGLTENSPFTFSFMDDNVKKSYDVYEKWMNTIDASCFIAILISCLGLFGLSGVTTINRTKEIGIRKILGASVQNLFLLINKGTFILAVAAFVIAAPIALYLVNEWLDNFAYRIKPDVWLFVWAGFLTLLTAIVAVSYHTLRAATANPVNSLRNE